MKDGCGGIHLGSQNFYSEMVGEERISLKPVDQLAPNV